LDRSKLLRMVLATSIWVLLLALCLSYGRPWHAEHAGVAFVCVATLLLVAFARLAPVREFLARLPRGHQVLVGIAVATLLLGHTLGSYRGTFPFVRWDMFTWPYEPDRVVFHELVGIRSDGTEVPLNHARLAPSLHSTFYWMLESWGEHARDGELAGRTYSVILSAFGERYNAQHPETPIRDVAAVRGTISRGEGGALEAQRASLWRVRLDQRPTQ
jgi:hypothetical protein